MSGRERRRVEVDAEGLEGLLAAAGALVRRLDAVHASPEYQGLFVLAHVHGVTYDGPSYGAELEALRNRLGLGLPGGER